MAYLRSYAMGDTEGFDNGCQVILVRLSGSDRRREILQFQTFGASRWQSPALSLFDIAGEAMEGSSRSKNRKFTGITNTVYINYEFQDNSLAFPAERACGRLSD